MYISRGAWFYTCASKISGWEITKGRGHYFRLEFKHEDTIWMINNINKLHNI